MKRFSLHRGTIGGPVLVGAAIVAFITLVSVLLPQFASTRIFIQPEEGRTTVGEIISIDVVVEANEPVNAFAGDVVFDNEVFSVERIDYNTSIAELWVTEPWYSKAENTVYFAGGTTRTGGFTGNGVLMTIHLRANHDGFVDVSLQNARMLRHDGLGSDVSLPVSIDAVFTAEEEMEKSERAYVAEQRSWYQVGDASPSTDINNDGRTTLADLSIFMLNVGSNNIRYDLNQDGTVSIKDLSVLMEAL